MIEAKQLHLTVSDDSDGSRLDKFLADHLEDYSRSFLQKLIADKHIQVNQQPVRASYRLSTGEQIHIHIPAPEETELLAEDIPLDIVFEDSDLIVINKPAGMVVHPGAGNPNGTLVNALMHYCKDLSGIGGRLRPGIVHRLDKNTSGLLVVAKNDITHVALQNQFSDKTAYREYRALVWGKPDPAEGVLENHLERSKSDRKLFRVGDSGKLAITQYSTEQNLDFISLLNIRLKTGRTHQIRVHMRHIGHPVFGDPEYAGRDRQLNRLSALSKRNFAVYLLKHLRHQALHAYRLGFVHPTLGEHKEFTVNLSKRFALILEKLQKHEESQNG